MTSAPETTRTADAEVIWQRSDDLAQVEHEDRTVVLDLRQTDSVDGPTPYVLSDSAHLVWSALTAPATVEEITRVVAEQTGTDPADLVSPVGAFLAELEATGLVRATPPHPHRSSEARDS